MTKVQIVLMSLIFLALLLPCSAIRAQEANPLQVFYGATPEHILVDIPDADSTLVANVFDMLGNRVPALPYLTSDGRLLLTWENGPIHVPYLLYLANDEGRRIVKLHYFGLIVVPMGLIPAEDVKCLSDSAASR